MRVQPVHCFFINEASSCDQVEQRNDLMKYKTLHREKAHQFNRIQANYEKINLGDFKMAAEILVVQKIMENFCKIPELRAP